MISIHRIMGIIFFLVGSFLAMDLVVTIFEYNQEFGCGDILCEVEEEPFLNALIYTFPVIAVGYYYDGPIRTRWRNIIMYILIFISGIFLVVFLQDLFVFSILLLFTAYDSGKNSAMMGNKQLIMDLISHRDDLQSASEYLGTTSSTKNFVVDGLIGLGVVSTTSLHLAFDYDLIPDDLQFILLPEIFIFDLPIDLHDVSVFLSIILIIWRSGKFYRDKLINNKIVSVILGKRASSKWFRWLVSVIVIVIFYVLYNLVVFAFAWYNTSPQFHPFIQAIMVSIWGLGYLLNAA